MSYWCWGGPTNWSLPDTCSNNGALRKIALRSEKISVLDSSVWPYCCWQVLPAVTIQNSLFTNLHKKLRIVATLFPLYDFARIIGGDKAEVTLLLPPGVEAHTFEPRPEDAVKTARAGLFSYTNKIYGALGRELCLRSG